MSMVCTVVIKMPKATEQRKEKKGVRLRRLTLKQRLDILSKLKSNVLVKDLMREYNVGAVDHIMMSCTGTKK